MTDYLVNLGPVLEEDRAELLRKEKTYKGSWKKRGGVGAFMMLARKWDRLENMAKDVGYDILDGLRREIEVARRSETVGQDGSMLAEIRDLRRYLLLVEAEVIAHEGKVDTETTVDKYGRVETRRIPVTEEKPQRVREAMDRCTGRQGLAERVTAPAKLVTPASYTYELGDSRELKQLIEVHEKTSSGMLFNLEPHHYEMRGNGFKLLAPPQGAVYYTADFWLPEKNWTVPIANYQFPSGDLLDFVLPALQRHADYLAMDKKRVSEPREEHQRTTEVWHRITTAVNDIEGIVVPPEARGR